LRSFKQKSVDYCALNVHLLLFVKIDIEFKHGPLK
jgi:hypothetical protein